MCVNSERTTPNKRSRGKVQGLAKLRKNDIRQINPYIVPMLSEKTA